MSWTTSRVTRRAAIRGLAATGLAMPAVFRAHAASAPSETLYHASFGASGMGGADLHSLTASPHVKLVAVADVDLRNTAAVKKEFPDVRVYQDWRELLDKEKHLDSVNVSTPDHMHAPITMRALQRGLHVYTQKPLTQTLYEARQITRTAREKKLVTQMGIQIHSHEIHRHGGGHTSGKAIGKVKEVHSWSGKYWGDPAPTPDRSDPVPAELSWDSWLGVAPARPFIAGYYHPGEWRKRLDFGTGTFGDMGCHILDPVFTSLALTAPNSLRSEGGAAGRRQLGDRQPGALRLSEHEVHDRDAHAALVRRWQAAPGADQGPDRRAAALGPGLDLHRHRGRALFPVYRVTRVAARRAVQGLQAAQPRAAPTTTSSSSRHAAATARPRRPSTTPVRSPSRSSWAAWRPDFPGRPSSGMLPT